MFWDIFGEYMSHLYNLPKARKGSRVRDVLHVREAIKNALTKLAGSEEREQLRRLWENWPMVMGEDMAGLAMPLGHRKNVLLIGAEDHLVMQELSFCTPEILERVNAFMDSAYFEKIELHLHMGQAVLDLPPPELASMGSPPPIECPAGLTGSFAAMPGLNMDSPVARCYMAYLKLHGLA